MLACAGVAAAQTVQTQPLPEVKGAPAKTPQKNAAQPPAGGGGGSSGEQAGLRQRVEQLEEQLVDLQVVIGTLESLARTGGATSAPARSEASSGVAVGDKGRLDSIETQIRALTAQVEQLASDVRNGAQRKSDAGGVSPGYADGGPQTSRFGSTTVTSDNADPIGALAEANPGPDRSPASGPSSSSSRFDAGPSAGTGAAPTGSVSGAAPPTGSGTTPQGSTPRAAPPNSLSGAAPPTTYGSEALPPAGGGGGGQIAALDPASTGGNPKQLYETAYGHLLQQDYGAAQAGFRDFLKNFPQDPLAPNALYWLGEAHYVQRNYADAAEAFDLVLSAYGTSGKAPDAQLKRGMSLAQLGKRQDACTSLRAVTSKYPSAPAHLKAKADSERQRIGCP